MLVWKWIQSRACGHWKYCQNNTISWLLLAFGSPGMLRLHQQSDPYSTVMPPYIFFSSLLSNRILSFSEDSIEEIDIEGFKTNEQTYYAANAAHGYILQVSTCVKIYYRYWNGHVTTGKMSLMTRTKWSASINPNKLNTRYRIIFAAIFFYLE